MVSEKMLALANRRLENLEVFLMSVCEFEPFYDYLTHYAFKSGKTYSGPKEWYKSYKKFLHQVQRMQPLVRLLLCDG